MSSTCFVTVGTTRFDQLINAVVSDECVRCLKAIGVEEIILQIGAGDDDIARKIVGDSYSDLPASGIFHGVKVQFYRYKPSLIHDMSNAKLVIGHAGAGTVLECMKLRQPLIVVINEGLADNHQVELAAKLASLNHLMYCTPADLASTLETFASVQLRPYDSPNLAKVASFIDRTLQTQY